ncbi:hypothetical protein XCCB100_1017 [Xanthomonas campestris pv. campestris]|uniref:Uncharacterized protein n=1 Tax=Xanthomonas campestris pv. campestris (strain B100) TaxID=509169 RepID=B0RPI0_XANCB|nr:hypothetical protein XCCB100_1017 [Xanthomonas campestris pv. campestris]
MERMVFTFFRGWFSGIADVLSARPWWYWPTPIPVKAPIEDSLEGDRTRSASAHPQRRTRARHQQRVRKEAGPDGLDPDENA